MAVFPADTCILVAGYSEEFDPSVAITEMERGPAKLRVLNSNVVARIPCALLFDSAAAAADFEDWYFNTINRIGWFTVTHPRTGATITARFEGGALGPLAPVSNSRRRWRREVTLEYMR